MKCLPHARRVHRVGLALVLASCGGCVRAELRPTLPMRSLCDGVVTEVQAVHVGREHEIELRVTAPTGQRIQRAFLTVPSRLPCQGGLEPLAITVDGAPGVDVPAGSHEVRARFEPDDFSSDLVLDLDMKDGRCVRTAVYSTILPFEVASRTIVSMSLPVMANSTVRGFNGVVGVQVGVGRWFGRLRLLGEAGLGVGFCDKSTCGKDEQGQAKGGLAVPISAEATWRALQWSSGRGSHFGLLGLRYGYALVSLPAQGGDGDDRFGVHSAHLQLGWGWVERLKGGHHNLQNAESMELTIPVGTVVTPGGQIGFSAGMSVRFLFPI
jgi:hypothetical protein